MAQPGQEQEQSNPLHGRFPRETEIASGGAGGGGLPAGWVQREHRGRAYYVNTATRERTWTHPAEGREARRPQPQLPAGWVQRMHGGRPFYVNTATRERTWTRPEHEPPQPRVAEEAHQLREPELPAGWVEKTHGGRSYYENAATGARTRARPGRVAVEV